MINVFKKGLNILFLNSSIGKRVFALQKEIGFRKKI